MKWTRVSTVAAATAVIMLSTLISGCSSSNANGPIRVWLPPFASSSSELSDIEAWDQIVAPFEEANDVDVEVTIVPWENFEERFLTGFSGGEGPDLGYMYAEMIGDYITRGQLESFEPYVTDEQRATYYFLEQGQYDGEQYGLPIVVGGARVVYYNKAVLAEAGVAEPPVTWDDFVDASLKIKDSGATPFVMAWGAPGTAVMGANFFPFLWQAGGEIINEDGTAAAFNSDAGLRATQFLADLRFKHGILDESTTAMNEEEVSAAFSGGKVGFVLGSDAEAPIYRDAGVDFGVVPALRDQETATFVATDVLVIAKTASDKKLVAELAAFILSGDSMTKFHEIAQYPPIGSDEPYAGDDAFKSLYTENANILHQYPVVANSAPLYAGLYEKLQQVMLGSITPEQALQEASDAADISLSQNVK